MAALGLVLGPRHGGVKPRSLAGALRDFGPFALGVYLLATARWGSYLLPGPPYISDLFILLLLAERGVAAARGRPALGRIEASVGVVCGCVLVWSALRFAFGTVSANAIRDVAPYGYAVLVYLTPSRAFSDFDRRQMERVLFAALLFHTAWLTLERLDGSFVLTLPSLGGGQSRLFEERSDVDGTICTVMALLCLNRAIAGRSPALNLLLAAWNATLVLTGHSRAALASAAVQVVVFALFTPARRELARRHAPRVIICVLILAIPGLAYGLTKGQAGTRLGAAAGAYLPFVPTHGPVGGSATDTARARLKAWQAIEVYIEAKPARDWFGVGFGPDFLHDSGGDQLLLGGTNEDVRQPHNFLINTWARIGLIGLGMVIAMLAMGVRAAALVSRRGSLGDVDLAAVLIVTGFPVAAIYGVVLESPFGALPYFWALGYLGWRLLELRSRAPRAPLTKLVA